MRRRDFLAAIGIGMVVGTAGCGSSGSAPTPTQTSTQTPIANPTSTPANLRAAADPFSDMNTDTSGEGFVKSGTVTLSESRYAHLKVAPPDAFVIDGTVDSAESPFDFIGMRHEELEAYHTRADYEDLSSITKLAVSSAEFEAELPTGEYRLVFDNTSMGDAPPAAEVVIDFEWRIRPP